MFGSYVGDSSRRTPAVRYRDCLHVRAATERVECRHVLGEAAVELCELGVDASGERLVGRDQRCRGWGIRVLGERQDRRQPRVELRWEHARVFGLDLHQRALDRRQALGEAPGGVLDCLHLYPPRPAPYLPGAPQTSKRGSGRRCACYSPVLAMRPNKSRGLRRLESPPRATTTLSAASSWPGGVSSML